MKSRREIISGLLIDIAKALFISLFIGKIVGAVVLGWNIVVIGLTSIVFLIIVAIYLQPSASVDKEIGL